MKNSTSRTSNKSIKYKRNNKNNKSNSNNMNNKRNKNNYNGKGGTQLERSCLCVPWGGGAAPLFLFWLESYVGTAWVLSTFICALQGSKERDIDKPCDTAPTGNTPWVKGCEAVLGRRSSWSILDASAPLQVVAELWSFIEGELQVEPKNVSP